MLPVPANLPDRFKPFVDLLDGAMVTSRQLAQRWNLSEQTLANDRTAGKNLPFVRLPGGSVRYYVSEIMAAELAGARGPLSIDRVALELAAMAEVSDTLAAAILTRLRLALEAPA
jgi:hypothetical protein